MPLFRIHSRAKTPQIGYVFQVMTLSKPKILGLPIKPSLHVVGWICILFLASAGAGEADLEPPPPVLSPAESLRAFQIAEPGCRIELVASEPMVQDPVAMAFDGEGRLWVVEMRGYMQDIKRSGVHDRIGRISVLEDTDADGVMDKNTVFLDQLILPRAILVQPGGVLIAENKPLWFARDTDGDLVADEKTLVVADYAKDDIEHSANGLLRAMDNWIYNANDNHRYRSDGDRWRREATEARGQWGICHDDRGRLFYNFNHTQLLCDLVPPNTLTRNPNHDPTAGLSVGVTNTNAVFPIRPNRATNRGYIPGALDEQGRIKEFTSACAPFVYREALFPGFSGNAFVCETVGNLIKRSVLSENGLYVTGTSAYEGRDFIASTDERFRPCSIITGPDGAIYIADMYRGIVQDGVHMSTYLREHSEARAMDQPIHLGRIWRVVPDGFRQPAPPSFARMKPDELVMHLANPNGWWRDQAQMHLVERLLTAALPALRQMALTHASPQARLHALWTLEGLRDPQPRELSAALNDAVPHIRAAALRVLQSLGMSHSELLAHILRGSETAPPQEVALQMILTIGDLNISDPDRLVALQKIAAPWLADPLMRDAVMSSLAQRESAFLSALWTVQEVPGLAFLMEALAQAIIKSRDAGRISNLLSLLAGSDFDWRKQALWTGISIRQAELMTNPVSLNVAPPHLDQHPELRRCFAWPGHVPEPLAKSDVKPLTPAQQTLFAQGRQNFLTYCVACHGADGKGVKFLGPPLAGSHWVMGSPGQLARVLFHGLSGPINVSGKRYESPEIQPFMPPLAALGNEEIAAVLTYIRRAWENHAAPISPGEINKLRIESQGRTIPWTEEELAPFRTSKP